MKYADPDVAKHVLARWELRDFRAPTDRIVSRSSGRRRRVMLEHPAQRERCCHTGGGMTWDRNGNLYIAVGNNTGGGMTDERPGYENSDDQRSRRTRTTCAARSCAFIRSLTDLHDSARQSLPAGHGEDAAGDLHDGPPQSLAHLGRQPHGLHLLGRVGPDAASDRRRRPDALRRAQSGARPGNFGLPYFVGRTNPSYSVRLRQEPAAAGRRIRRSRSNTSVNNTGLSELPPAQPAFIAYPYGSSERYPARRHRRAVARSADRSITGRTSAEAPRPFPAYYEGKWLAADSCAAGSWRSRWTRRASTSRMERFLPSYRPHGIIDLKFAPTATSTCSTTAARGSAKSEDAQLVRIEYNAGNRAPARRSSGRPARRRRAVQGRAVVNGHP